MEVLSKKIKETLKQTMLKLGLDNLAATIVITLFLEPEPICMENLAKKTGYSLPSISLKMKSLPVVMNGIKLSRKPGSRKTYIYMEKDIFKLFTKRVDAGYNLIASMVDGHIKPLISEYKKKAATEKDKKRVQILETYINDLEEFGKMIKDLQTKANEILKKRESLKHI